MRKGKKSLICMGGSLLAAVLITAWPIPVPVEVETTVVHSGELVQTVLLNGTVDAEIQPCVSPFLGRVSHVYAQPGMAVSKGDLLFKLDTSAQEEMLSQLYEQRFLFLSAAEEIAQAAAVYSAQLEQERIALENQLQTLIEGSYIRATQDGTISAVYVQEGDMVLETTVLGAVRGKKLQIQCRVHGSEGNSLGFNAAGMAFSYGRQVPVVLCKQESMGEAAIWYFEPAERNGLEDLQSGGNIRLEMIKAILPADALIPLAAIDSQNGVWVVRDGKATRKKITIGECSRTHTMAGAEWQNEILILQPERYQLSDGMNVRVKR